jgi:LacI family transcriptional regulator
VLKLRKPFLILVEELPKSIVAPTAIFARNDTVAIGVLAALKANGIRVPQDVTITSIDDIPAARFMNPALTTVHVPAQDFGRIAGEMLVKSNSFTANAPNRRA